MNPADRNPLKFTLAYYTGNRRTGRIAVVDHANGETHVSHLAIEPESNLEKECKPVFVGLTEGREVILLDPVSKEIRVQPSFLEDAFPAHIYSDPNSSRDWFMNDGDKETGNDRLNCGDQGSSVSVVADTSSSAAAYLGTICVGRGHHQATFTYPSDSAPQVPHTAYISNLKDGTISVIGNDPRQAGDYLKVVATINLCEPEREKEGDGSVAIPNNAFPHGLVYSPLSGKVYNLNNGYGTMVLIDPLNHAIVERHDFKGHSNLFVTPDGRYVIGRGADRKSDPRHVIARLSVFDVLSSETPGRTELRDIYISKYYFNAQGSKLYLTTGKSGTPEQQKNLKTDALLIFDLTALPEMKLIKEHRLGCSSGSLAFLNEDGRTSLVFSSNSEQGTVTVIDGESDEIVETLAVTEGASHSRAWLLSPHRE